MNLSVLYCAAHAHFPDTEPLGGGKAVADYLVREWSGEPGRGTAIDPGGRDGPIAEVTVLSPRSLGIPLVQSLTGMTAWEYARFCRQFGRAATAEILRHDPRACVVLSNDISEGPDFALLGARGYRLVTIFHVDVVEYFTRFYLRGLVRPETAARWSRFGWLPDLLQLVFHQQADAVRHSARLVVPSAPMKETIRRCYPWCDAGKIMVLPWGNIAPATTASGDACAVQWFPIADDEFVILTLSRLSPEKGIERLLAALPYLDDLTKLRVFISGGAAYMQGRTYERKLRRLAARAPVPVEFTGHVTGSRKAALLERADLFVSPSRHESYGLTIEEALAAGCRAISHAHHGARGQVVDCGDPQQLASAIRAAVTDGRTRKPAVPSPARADTAAGLMAALQALAREPAVASPPGSHHGLP